MPWKYFSPEKKEPPKNFSGGMQQRVQISKALANNPAILLLDEVTTGLDLSVQARVLELIRKIRQEFHISIMLVSHDLAVIRMLADQNHRHAGRKDHRAGADRSDPRRSRSSHIPSSWSIRCCRQENRSVTRIRKSTVKGNHLSGGKEFE